MMVHFTDAYMRHSASISKRLIISLIFALFCSRLKFPSLRLDYIQRYTVHPHRYADCSSIVAWWRHQMETFTPSLALCEGTPQKDQWRGALMFSVICAWTNGWRKQSRRRWFETMLPHRFQEIRQSVVLSKLCSRPWQAGWFETPSRSLWNHCSMWLGNGQLTPALHHYFIGTGTIVGLHGHRWWYH